MRNKGLKQYHIYQGVFATFLGIGIIYWLYKDFDFSEVGSLLKNDTKWGWMLFSLLFGVLSHVVRGLRWRLALKPLGVFPKTKNCVNAIFISYFTNMLIPRIGELSRCVVLKKYDGVSFSQSFGSVVAERFVDTLCILLLTATTILLQLPLFVNFFGRTGIQIPILDYKLIILVLIGTIVVLVALWFVLKRNRSFLEKLRQFVKKTLEGFFALKMMGRASWLYIFYTIMMWLFYFLHFYLTFNCFGFTENLGFMAGMALFVVGTFAIIVPTPNGAGSWHFAIITMLLLYNISESNARFFALIVHSIQSILVILLGIYGFLATSISNKNQEK